MGIVVVQPVIFRGNPQITLPVTHKLPDSVTANRVFIGNGIEVLKIRILLRNIVHTAKVTSNPNPPFPIFKEGINGIIRNRQIIVCFISDMLNRPIFQDVNAAFRTYPILIF